MSKNGENFGPEFLSLLSTLKFKPEPEFVQLEVELVRRALVQTPSLLLSPSPCLWATPSPTRSQPDSEAQAEQRVRLLEGRPGPLTDSEWQAHRHWHGDSGSAALSGRLAVTEPPQWDHARRDRRPRAPALTSRTRSPPGLCPWQCTQAQAGTGTGTGNFKLPVPVPGFKFTATATANLLSS